MINKKKKEGSACRMCGRCCRMEIPLTLLDIHRMANFKGVPASKAFQDVVQDEISKRSSLFMIRKDEKGVCLFLSNNKKCLIHAVKPDVCRFYSCSLQAESDVMPWTATCTDLSQRAQLWEQSVAAMVTKAYIKKNGAGWNEADYHMALKGILENIQVRDTQKLKLARNAQGEPAAMIYDCSQCENKGGCAKETPVTLDDIRRISARLQITWNQFFKIYIAPETSFGTGGLKLKRDKRCVFFDPQRQCRIEEVKPLHCRFTPCPVRTKTSEMMDAFYLGSGTLQEQFRHQVAMAVTRDHVAECGTGFRKSKMEKSLERLDKLVASTSELKGFCKRIARWRYVDDTLSVLDA